MNKYVVAMSNSMDSKITQYVVFADTEIKALCHILGEEYDSALEVQSTEDFMSSVWHEQEVSLAITKV